MKKIICVLLSLCMLLSLTGCGSTQNEPAQTTPTSTGSKAENPDNTAALATTEGTHPTESTQATEAAGEMDAAAADSLAIFRNALVGTPRQFAVAYFGYALPEGNMPANPLAVIEGTAPQLWDDLPFLQQIPPQNILGTDGHLFCIVPTDENATVSVNWSLWDEATETFTEETVLYRSEKGDPFLLMTTNTGWRMETEVILTDSSGEVTVWYPFIDEDNRIAPLCDDSGESLYYDFTPYDRLNAEELPGGAPIDMVGSWELIWTEAEGDRQKAASGMCTLEITTDGTGFFWLSYTDRNYPEDNFLESELCVSDGELYPGCGNNQWFANVYTPGNERIHHALTLSGDGTLLMQYSWEIDGMPMVSYGCFQRIS